MKPVNFALVALAGFGLVTSQVAFADTLPAASVPAVAAHGHAVKAVRLTEKRKSADSEFASIAPLGFVIGAIALGGTIYAITEVSKSSSSTGT